MIVEMVKDQGHNFLKLFWANFPKFLGSGYFASESKIVFLFIKTNRFNFFLKTTKKEGIKALKFTISEFIW